MSEPTVNPFLIPRLQTAISEELDRLKANDPGLVFGVLAHDPKTGMTLHVGQIDPLVMVRLSMDVIQASMVAMMQRGTN